MRHSRYKIAFHAMEISSLPTAVCDRDQYVNGGSVRNHPQATKCCAHATETRLQNAASVVTNAINRQLLQVDGALISLPGLFAANSDQKKRELGR
jgi:hypothetical protein